MTDFIAQTKLLAEMSPLALKRRDHVLKLAADLHAFAKALEEDANDPKDLVNETYLGREWYNCMKCVGETGRIVFATFFLPSEITKPGDEDAAQIRLDALRATQNGGSVQ